MMTDEERMKKIRRRTEEIRKQDRQKKQFILDLGCVAACVVVIICIGMYMPSLMGGFSFQNVQSSAATASIIAKNNALGYIIMGILSFVLGVCLTILLYRLRERNRQDKQERDVDEF